MHPCMCVSAGKCLLEIDPQIRVDVLTHFREIKKIVYTLRIQMYDILPFYFVYKSMMFYDILNSFLFKKKHKLNTKL